ncbi:hypothetical protein VTN49DRAFT_3364 [Thermomyces lanuginosus]|uniref:uncharacterized protein n=1 Tax=Thermomyces lanuginosus TaxID=5541 RepID=UPI003743FBA3
MATQTNHPGLLQQRANPDVVAAREPFTPLTHSPFDSDRATRLFRVPDWLRKSPAHHRPLSSTFSPSGFSATPSMVNRHAFRL